MSAAIVDLEDDDFLSKVAAAEAHALSTSKRRKTNAVTATNSSQFQAKTSEFHNTTATAAATEEGAYTAALRGSKSLLFKPQAFSAAAIIINAGCSNKLNHHSAGGGGNGGSGGSCFNCGQLGHWACDCDLTNTKDSSSVPEKACPCGLGDCVVRTANTEKNRGRKFYKCPFSEESGGCGFFEWCDKFSGSDIITSKSLTCKSNPSLLELLCPCGAGSCLVLTAKTGKNIGQQFYYCPASQGKCGFFKWCNDHTVTAGVPDSINTPNYRRDCQWERETVRPSFPSAADNIEKSASACTCFRCGKPGHWAKDCLQFSVVPTIDPIEKSASAGICFRCGNPGHWAKDCLQPSVPFSVDIEGKSTTLGACFKCGKPGHWAKDCSSSSFPSRTDAGGKSASPGACFKCGKPGHWAKDCCPSTT